MITAHEAYIATRYQGEVDRIIKIYEHAIDKAIQEGKYFATIMIHKKTPRKVVECVMRILMDGCYAIHIKDDGEYDRVTINWGGITE